LRRTQETANILAELLGVRRLITDQALIERDFGILTGKTYDDIPTHATEWLQLPNYRYFINGDGVEPFEAVRERVHQLRSRIISRHPGERVLIVSHGDVYKMFLAECQGLTILDALHTPFIENASISDFGIQKV
jgi:probable phosphoglycerate mutase